MSGFLGGIATAGGIVGLAGDLLGLNQTDVTLGGFTFDGSTIEVPEAMRWGTTQRLVRHNLPGGIVRINAMGVDWPPISWKGVFDKSDAKDRAKALSTLTAAGAPLTLTWMDRVFVVVIQQFQAEDKTDAWVEYHITCMVVADADQIDGPPAPPTLLQQITADFNTALGYVSQALAVISTVQTVLLVADSLTLGTAANGELVAALAAFQASQTQAQATAESGIAGLGTSAAGATGASYWLTYGQTLTANLANAVAASGPIGRAIANLQQASA